jgi:hypothetical protein
MAAVVHQFVQVHATSGDRTLVESDQVEGEQSEQDDSDGDQHDSE